MKTRKCEMMRQVIASEGNGKSYEIVYRELKCLELHCLLSLPAFVQGTTSSAFHLRMNNFYQGVLSTPKLHKVQVAKTDFADVGLATWMPQWSNYTKKQNVELSENKSMKIAFTCEKLD
ncbi:hypothetical protein GOBAR_DD35490 [Gossypium barbadense]|nr:hypothetical protein GOBAR_DD35490 [Gossypium barbadense]